MSEKKWFQIFRAGKYKVQTTAGEIRTFEYTEKDIQDIVDSYDPQFMEVPLTIDHVQNGPAFGWVDELRKSGTTLEACFKDIVDGLVEAVNQKQYKRISSEIIDSFENSKGNRTRAIKAVSFLGVATPAVKGMKPVMFDDKIQFFSHDFFENDLEPVVVELSEKLTASETLVATLSEQVSTFTSQLAAANEQIAKFADIEALKAQAEARSVALEMEMRKMGYQLFLTDQIRYGRLTPAQMENALKIMTDLDNVGKFSDAPGSPLDNWKKLIEDSGTVVSVEEMATKKKMKPSSEGSVNFSDPNSIAKAAQHLVDAAEKKGEALSYAQAISQVSNERK